MLKIKFSGKMYTLGDFDEKTRFTENQIIAILKEGVAGVQVKEIGPPLIFVKECWKFYFSTVNLAGKLTVLGCTMEPCFAPVCIFAYKRIDLLQATIDSLLENKLCKETELYIFSDGAKEGEELLVAQVRKYILEISGFKRISLFESPVNLGLSKSVISGVSEVLKRHDRVIVVEDDLIFSPAFLNYMNQALEAYRFSNQILSISGFSYPIKYPEKYCYDVTFGIRASSWGWATWKDRWNIIDWDVKDYNAFKNNFWQRYQFNKGGSDLFTMLDRCMSGKIDSWAVRFCYHQFKHGLYDVFPVHSLTSNIGWGLCSTNCKIDVRSYRTELWDTPPNTFSFPKDIKPIPEVLCQFQGYNSYSARALRVIKRGLSACFS